MLGCRVVVVVVKWCGSGAVIPSVRREKTQATSRIRVVATCIAHTTAAARCDYPETRSFVICLKSSDTEAYIGLALILKYHLKV